VPLDGLAANQLEAEGELEAAPPGAPPSRRWTPIRATPWKAIC